jgi:hypothetical protein
MALGSAGRHVCELIRPEIFECLKFNFLQYACCIPNASIPNSTVPCSLCVESVALSARPTAGACAQQPFGTLPHAFYCKSEFSAPSEQQDSLSAQQLQARLPMGNVLGHAKRIWKGPAAFT